MHLVFLHLPLSVLFLKHTLQHNGGVGSRWKHQQELQQAREKRAIQSEHCLARAHDKDEQVRVSEEKEKAMSRTASPAREEPLAVMLCLSLPLCITLSHYFLSSCTQLPQGSSVHAGVYIYTHTCRMAQDRQIASSPICQFHSNSGWQHLKWISI